MYREYRPENLNPIIDAIWSSDSEIEPDKGHQAPPCVTSDLIIKLYQSDFEVILSGPMTQQKSFPWVEGAHYFGIRFASGVGNLFREASLRELVDSSAALNTLAGVDLSQLAEQLASSLSWEAQISVLTRSTQNLGVPNHRNHNVDYAKDIIHNTNGNVQIQELAKHIRISQRHLERLFLNFTGLSPKKYCQIVRLNHFIDLISSDRNQSLAKVAADCGFADQSHLTQEFRNMMGQTPFAYLNNA